MIRHLKSAVAACALLATGSGSAIPQSFTCPYGKQPSCLDYSDKVCSSFSKCVDQNAACFDSWQCDYEGFTCKSNVTDLAEKHDALVHEYNELLRKSRTLASDYDRLLADSRSLTNEYDDLKSRLDDMQACLHRADDLEEAQACSL